MHRTDQSLDDADRLNSLLDGLSGHATAGYHGLNYRRDVPDVPNGSTKIRRQCTNCGARLNVHIPKKCPECGMDTEVTE